MEDLLDPSLGDGFDRDVFRDYLRSIREEVFRCRGITKKLLGFARRTASTIEPQDANGLVRESVGLIAKELTLENIRVELDLAEGLPEIRTDGEKIKQVILNLVRNAADAIGKDGTITVRTARAREGISLRVADTGVGIPPEVLDKIFLPFFTTKEVGKGTGLGLSISHGIVTSLGGSIDVASKVGEGTTFEIRLPVEAPRGDARESS
jgi:two-component system, NtrC family, sensor kinase